MVYAYRILLSFNTPVTYKKSLTSRRTSRFFAGHFPMSGTNTGAQIKGGGGCLPAAF